MLDYGGGDVVFCVPGGVWCYSGTGGFIIPRLYDCYLTVPTYVWFYSWCECDAMGYDRASLAEVSSLGLINERGNDLTGRFLSS